jgi:proteasome accessory factor B
MRDQDVVDILYQGLTILNTLLENAGKSVSRRDLAAKTGLAPRQVGRYLNTLEAMGFPLQRRQRGREEMVAMPRTVSRRLRLLPFTTPELLALSFYTSLSSSVHDTTPLGHLHTACPKIATFLGQDFQPDSALRRAFLSCVKHYKLYGTPQTHAILPTLIAALLESQVCDITYQTPRAATARRHRIQPYTLCLYDRGLYLFAYRPVQATLMVLSVERIRTLQPDTTGFARDPQVLQAIADRRQRAFGIIDDDEVHNVTLKVSAAQAPYMRERLWHPSQRLEEQADGSLIIRFQASGAFEILRWILGWGSAVEVLAPLAFRRELAQRLHTAAQQYAGDGDTATVEGTTGVDDGTTAP